LENVNSGLRTWNIEMHDPPYRLAESGCRAPTPWTYWVVAGRLLAGSFPTTSCPKESHQRIVSLLEAGILTFVDLTEEWELNRFGETLLPYPDFVQHLTVTREVECRRWAILDMAVPEPEFMEAILGDIDRSLAESRPVYVHCWGGMGRTGTVVGCWLLRHGLATPANVLDVIQQLRLQDEVHGHFDSPQTPEQRQFVEDWH
jgi:hypothetical protein